MEQLPLEIKSIIWSKITSDEELRSCALVNWEWYSKCFAQRAIGQTKRGNSKDTSEGYQPFSSEVLDHKGVAQAYGSVTQLINKFQADKAEWFNRAYTPYILELNLQFLKVGLNASGLKFTGLKTVVGDAKQLLSLFGTSGVIQLEQLQNLSVKLDSQSVSERVVERLFDKLGEFNIHRLRIEMCEDWGPEIAIAMTPSIRKFLAQLTRLEIKKAHLSSDIFRYLSDLEVLTIDDKLELFGFGEDFHVTKATRMTDSMINVLGERLTQLKIVTNDDYLGSNFGYLKYLEHLEKRTTKGVYTDKNGHDRRDGFLELAYIGKVCANINKYSKNIELVAFGDDQIELIGETLRGFELDTSARYASECPQSNSFQYHGNVNVFTLKSSEGSPLFSLKGLSMDTVGSMHAPALAKLGRAFQQLESIEFDIRVDFSTVSAPNGAVFFPNLLRSQGKVLSLSRSHCICRWVQKHMPRAMFNGYGLYCVHCVCRNGDVDGVVEIDSYSGFHKDYPRWNSGDKGCPNMKKILEFPPGDFFEECV